MVYKYFSFEKNLFKYKDNFIFIDGDWGLGIGDWAQSPIPNPQFKFKWKNMK